MAEQYVEQDPAKSLELPEIQSSDNITNILDAPSLREAREAVGEEDEFKDYQKGYTDADPTPAHGTERPDTRFVTEDDKAITKGQFREHGDSLDKLDAPKTGLATRMLGKIAGGNLVARTENVNSGDTTEPVITRTPEITAEQQVVQHPHESQAGVDIRREKARQQDFLNDPRIADVDNYNNGTDEADVNSAKANWSDETGPKVNK